MYCFIPRCSLARKSLITNDSIHEIFPFKELELTSILINGFEDCLKAINKSQYEQLQVLYHFTFDPKFDDCCIAL